MIATLAVIAGGCAAIAGLDQTYIVLPDGGVSTGEPGDATMSDGAMSGRDGAASDASGQDGSAQPIADGAVDAGADAAPTWAFDENFGQDGVLYLGDTMAVGSLPVLSVDEQQTVRVAFTDDTNETLVACEPSANDAGCTRYSSSAGFPIDLASNDAGTVVVLNAAGATPSALDEVSLFTPGYSPTTSSPCLGVDALSLDDSGNLQVVATEDSSVRLITLVPQNTVVDHEIASVGNGLLSRAVPAASQGQVWLAGSLGGNGVYAQVHLDGTGTVGRGGLTTEGRTSYASDVLPTSATQALVVGGYSGGSSGIFAETVPTADDGGVHTIQNPYDLMGDTLVAEPNGHTRVLAVPYDPPYLVVGTTANYVVLLNVQADGTGGGLGRRPETLGITFGGLQSLALGGAVTVGDGVYLALALVTSMATAPIVVHLVRK